MKNRCLQTVVLEETLENSWKARRSNQSILRKSTLNTHCKDWCWSWSSNTLATWCQELTHWKRPWYRERFEGRGRKDNRGLDGWMASPTQWSWVWANSGSWLWTGKPGMLHSMGLKRAGHDWVTEFNWIVLWSFCNKDSLVAQIVKSLPAMQDT